MNESEPRPSSLRRCSVTQQRPWERVSYSDYPCPTSLLSQGPETAPSAVYQEMCKHLHLGLTHRRSLGEDARSSCRGQGAAGESRQERHQEVTSKLIPSTWRRDQVRRGRDLRSLRQLAYSTEALSPAVGLCSEATQAGINSRRRGHRAGGTQQGAGSVLAISIRASHVLVTSLMGWWQVQKRDQRAV